MIRPSSAIVCICLLTPAVVLGAAMRFDFQPPGGPLEPGYIAVDETDSYDASAGYGFVPGSEPARAVDGTGNTWNFFGRIVTVDEAIPESLLSAATVDAMTVQSPRGDPVGCQPSPRRIRPDGYRRIRTGEAARGGTQRRADRARCPRRGDRYGPDVQAAGGRRRADRMDV